MKTLRQISEEMQKADKDIATLGKYKRALGHISSNAMLFDNEEGSRIDMGYIAALENAIEFVKS